MDMDSAAAQAAANAQADLARAEAEAQALLNELEASDPAPRKKYSMPSPYAPGEGPRDPVAGVAPASGSQQLDSLFGGDGNWKPAFGGSTLPDNGSVPPNAGAILAQKIKDSQRPHGSH